MSDTYTPEELREAVRTGKVRLGPANTTVILPLLLPWRCCEEAKAKNCAACGEVGYTHGMWEAAYLRCFGCQDFLADVVKNRLGGSFPLRGEGTGNCGFREIGPDQLPPEEVAALDRLARDIAGRLGGEWALVAWRKDE